MRKVTIIIFLLVQTLCAIAFQAKQESVPLNVEDILNMPQFPDLVPISLSPNGAFLSYTIQYSKEQNTTSFFDEKGTPTDHSETTLFVVDVENGLEHVLIDIPSSSWGGSWSPNSRYLAFYSDHEEVLKAWIWDSKTSTLSKLSDLPARPFWGFEQVAWSPDSKAVLVKLVPAGKSLDDMNSLYPTQHSDMGQAESRISVYTNPLETSDDTRTIDDSESSFLNIELADLVLVDVETLNVQKIAKEVSTLSHRFSNDGQSIAYMARSTDDGKGFPFDKYDVWICEIGNKSRKVASRVIQSYGQGLSWSPDGRNLAFANNNVIQILNVESYKVTHSFDSDQLTLVKDFRPPLWQGNESLVTISRNSIWRMSLKSNDVIKVFGSDGDRIIDFVTRFETQEIASSQVIVLTRNRESKEMGFKSIDLESGESSQLYKDTAVITTDAPVELSISTDRKTLTFTYQTSTSPPEVWIADHKFEKPRKLTSIHKSLENYEFGGTLLINWNMDDGSTLSGTLVLPTDYSVGERYPLIVKVYGGSRPSNSVNSFGVNSGIDNLQLLASRGFAILLPDMPIDSGSPMKQISDIANTATKKVIQMGIADPERVAVFGHSYGGYCALAVAVQSDQYKTVMASAGLSNLISHYGGMHDDGTSPFKEWTESGQGRLGGNPWEFPERYIDNSPFFYLDQMTASALLIHGGADNTVFANASKETFSALRRLDKRAKLVIFEEEDHHPDTWSPENAIKFWEIIFDWLEKEL